MRIVKLGFMDRFGAVSGHELCNMRFLAAVYSGRVNFDIDSTGVRRKEVVLKRSKARKLFRGLCVLMVFSPLPCFLGLVGCFFGNRCRRLRKCLQQWKGRSVTLQGTARAREGRGERGVGIWGVGDRSA